MQATTLLIAEEGAHWIVQALAWRTRANEVVVALIQDRAESAGTFRGRVERRIDAMRRKGAWLEQILLLPGRRRVGTPDGEEMLLVIHRALAGCMPPLEVLLVPMAPGLVATVPWEPLRHVSCFSSHAVRTGVREVAQVSSEHPQQLVARPRHRALIGLRVLVVDDDLPTLEAVRELLQASGSLVRTAASAVEGMLAIDDFEPQVIVCDIAMPLEDGCSFMRRLRARERARGTTRTPALALTALVTDHDRRRTAAAGFQLHANKPVGIERLRDAVRVLSELQ